MRERPEYTQRIQFGGRVEFRQDDTGRLLAHWVDTHNVLAVPFDTPVPGYQNDTINTLRLWKAAATDEFNLGEFNAGSYPESVAAKPSAIGGESSPNKSSVGSIFSQTSVLMTDITMIGINGRL